MSDLHGLYGLPPGADFPAALVRGLIRRFADRPPEALADVEIIVNTARMQRRLRELLADGTARLLPRIRLITDLATDPLAPPHEHVSELRRQLELTQLITAALDRDPTMAPRGNAFALAETLVALLSEMQDEGVSPGTLAKLDVGEMSAHWDRSRAFLSIVETYARDGLPSGETGALRDAVARLVGEWRLNPPTHPVIVAGSTGSRGTTQMLMRGAARLPRGGVILPGFDFDQPAAIWARLMADDTLEDHPQYRFASILKALETGPESVRRWQADDPARPRNRVISLAMRPAPVTDRWLTEGAMLPDLPEALAGLALIEAADPRSEALSIALCLRDGVAHGKRVALITPDRNLARRVTAELDRWRILPDDSAGRPLAQSAPGRLLRQIAGMAGAPPTPAALLALLKHPLVHSAGGRGDHLRRTRMFELYLRHKGQPDVGVARITEWAAKHDEATRAWAQWLIEVLAPLSQDGVRPLSDHVALQMASAERLARGATSDGSGALWLEEAGAVALTAMKDLAADAGSGGVMTAAEYATLLDGYLSNGEVREAASVDPRVMIWGTLEARVQGADVVVLGGLNDGIWPPLPGPDPWLNRKMRHEAGLLSPERRVGLSAHDFQQAAAAPEVILSRALRDDETETVMSRWLNRLYNLVLGLGDRDGPRAWAGIRDRGQKWTDMARRLDSHRPTLPRARRPAPSPPIAVRPKQLSVTEIQTLIRDPFAIYARHVLRLRPLRPLTPEFDARLRGTVFHRVFERYLRAGIDPAGADARAAFLAITREILERDVPRPDIRILWFAQIERVAGWFLAEDAKLRATATPLAVEARCEMPLGTPDFTLVGKVDRIDRLSDGRLAIYDYKTGKPPSAKQMRRFDRQLLLEAAMAEQGGIAGVAPAEVAIIAHIGVGSTPEVSPHRLRDAAEETPFDPDTEFAELRQLVANYARRGRGYAARRAMEKLGYDGDYDHLARYGEWDASDTPERSDVE